MYTERELPKSNQSFLFWQSIVHILYPILDCILTGLTWSVLVTRWTGWFLPFSLPSFLSFSFFLSSISLCLYFISFISINLASRLSSISSILHCVRCLLSCAITWQHSVVGDPRTSSESTILRLLNNLSVSLYSIFRLFVYSILSIPSNLSIVSIPSFLYLLDGLHLWSVPDPPY